MRWSALVVFSVLAAGAGSAWAGTGGVSVRSTGVETIVRSASFERRIPGAWILPRVALDGTRGGLSTDGRTLVLARRVPARTTRFALLDGRTLAPRGVVSLGGAFAFDALSPDGSKLYLIEYVTVVGERRYRVRSYDIAAGRLDRRVIADKRSGWTAMEGEPLSRATAPDGSWAYTLYGSDSRVFVHALQTVAGYAVCVDLPLEPALAGGLRLRLAGATLSLIAGSGATRARIDTSRLRVIPSALAHG